MNHRALLPQSPYRANS